MCEGTVVSGDNGQAKATQNNTFYLFWQIKQKLNNSNFPNLSQPWKQLTVEEAAAYQRLWWALDSDHIMPDSLFWHYLNPPLHPKRTDLLHCVYMWLGTWKVLHGLSFPRTHLNSPKVLHYCSPWKVNLYIPSDMAHPHEQGLLFDQPEVLEIICMHKGRLFLLLPRSLFQVQDC